MSATIDSNYNNDIQKPKIETKVCYKSVRLIINWIVNILMFFTVLICMFYACRSIVSVFEWHIILSVLGYQFFMCQATLVMSPYNSWSMFIARRYKKHIHWLMQVVAALCVTLGMVAIYYIKAAHYTSVHGKLGLAALVCCLVSLLNGIFALYPNKLSSCINVFWVRFFHYITGIASIFLGTGSLCAAFKYGSFKAWTGHEDVFVPVLIAVTWLFTILVSLDFWILILNKIRNLF